MAKKKKWGITYHATVVAYTEVEAETEDDARDLFESYQDGHDLFNDQCDGAADEIDEIEEIVDSEEESDETEDETLKTYEIKFYFDKEYCIDIKANSDYEVACMFATDEDYRIRSYDADLVGSSDNTITSIRELTIDESNNFNERLKEASEEKVDGPVNCLAGWSQTQYPVKHLYKVNYYYRSYCMMDLVAASESEARRIFKQYHNQESDWEYHSSNNIISSVRFLGEVKEEE